MEYRPEADGEPSVAHCVRPRNGLAVELTDDDESVTSEEDGGKRESCGGMLCVGLCRRSCALVGRLG